MRTQMQLLTDAVNRKQWDKEEVKEYVESIAEHVAELDKLVDTVIREHDNAHRLPLRYCTDLCQWASQA